MPIFASKELLNVYKIEVDGIVYGYGEKIIVDLETFTKRVKYGWYIMDGSNDFISTRELLRKIRRADKVRILEKIR